jgi:2Fe-2S ferredoxin
MPKVVYVHPDGARTELDVRAGTTVMQAAVDHNVPGIIGECGGSAMCATCHVHVDDAWLGLLTAPDMVEEEMLGSTASPRQPSSRLGCQIPLTAALDGLVVRIPPTQS